MNPPDRRQAISIALKAFTSAPLREAGLELFEATGYKSEKRLELKPNSAGTFLAQFDRERKLDRKKAADIMVAVDSTNYRLTTDVGRLCFREMERDREDWEKS